MTRLPVQRRSFYTLLQIGAILAITLIGTLGFGIRVFAAPLVAPQAPPMPPAIQILFLFVLVAFVWFGGRAIARLLCDSKTEFTAIGIQRPVWSTPSFISLLHSQQEPIRIPASTILLALFHMLYHHTHGYSLLCRQRRRAYKAS